MYEIKVDQNYSDMLKNLSNQIETLNKTCPKKIISEFEDCVVDIEDDLEYIQELRKDIQLAQTQSKNSFAEMNMKIYFKHCCRAWSILNCLSDFEMVFKD